MIHEAELILCIKKILRRKKNEASSLTFFRDSLRSSVTVVTDYFSFNFYVYWNLKKNEKNKTKLINFFQKVSIQFKLFFFNSTNFIKQQLRQNEK